LVGCSGEASGPEPDLRIDLRVETPVVKLGENPRFTIYLVNDGTEAVTIVLPGDGSESGLRTPIVRWNPPFLYERRCGNIEALKSHEVIILGAGERTRLQKWVDRPTLSGPGKHEVSLELENIPDLKWGGIPLGEHDAAAMRKVRRTPRFKVRSNVVEVEVKE
jgi:hypothetical protein